ncbi:PP2C family protein-serine/threonine phosphatase [Nocardioides sp.]|uniref:PP2C family protein-serine/threonine phosphatase n=1 Tax=Nocardioides sp. TaxID=35761 RepID=UPI00351331A5
MGEISPLPDPAAEGHGQRRSAETPADPPTALVLAELRARLQERARVPDLGAGWRHQSAMLPALGVAYGGDFVISAQPAEGEHVQLVLVDTCGHGESAVPAALQLAGALQGLLSVVPPAGVLAAANTFLLSQPSGESIATAVQVEIDLVTGDYVVRSAGHPPALRLVGASGEFVVDHARGTALGVHDAPEFVESCGRLEPGECLLFYTDGVVEERGSDIDAGIDWLRRAARSALAEGWEGAADRILAGVASGEDDRAVLLLQRTPH